MTAEEIKGVPRRRSGGEGREGDNIEGAVGYRRRRRRGTSRQGDHLGCRQVYEGAQQKDGCWRRKPIEEVGSHDGLNANAQRCHSCGCEGVSRRSLLGSCCFFSPGVGGVAARSQAASSRDGARARRKMSRSEAPGRDSRQDALKQEELGDQRQKWTRHSRRQNTGTQEIGSGSG